MKMRCMCLCDRGHCIYVEDVRCVFMSEKVSSDFLIALPEECKEESRCPSGQETVGEGVC